MALTFDGVNKLIILSSGTTSLDIQETYSEWKEWVATGNNAQYLPAMRTVGGDPTVSGQRVAPYFFLLNGWRIRPQNSEHVLNVTGNLFVDGGGNPFVPVLGNYNVLVNMSTSVNAVSVETGVSGLTPEEATLLDNLIIEIRKKLNTSFYVAYED